MPENVEGDHDDVEWMTELEADNKGEYLSNRTAPAHAHPAPLPF